MISIGYQGIEGSNSEAVALKYVNENNIEEYELIPLISSKNVIKKLETKEIDYGVLATKNSSAGVVLETKEALDNKEHLFNIEYECSTNINHSLFKRKDINLNDLKYVASHPQALKQTKINRSKLYSNLEELEVEDTALAAKYLASNTIDKNTAVICRKNAGLMYDLDLIQDNLEDNSNNTTYFIVIKLK